MKASIFKCFIFILNRFLDYFRVPNITFVIILLILFLLLLLLLLLPFCYYIVQILPPSRPLHKGQQGSVVFKINGNWGSKKWWMIGNVIVVLIVIIAALIIHVNSINLHIFVFLIILTNMLPWCHGVVIINTVQLHLTESELRGTVRYKSCQWCVRDLRW